jgi:hypothetical protein
MDTQQHLIAAPPIPKEASDRSFTNEEELAAEILLSIQQNGAPASNAEPKTRKGQKENKDQRKSMSTRSAISINLISLAAKRFKRPIRDSLPPPWTVGYYIEGPLNIMKKERLIREKKYKIFFNASLKSIHNIAHRMHSKGWDLKYATIGNFNDPIINHCIMVPPEFGHVFADILSELQLAITAEGKTEILGFREGF